MDDERRGHASRDREGGAGNGVESGQELEGGAGPVPVDGRVRLVAGGTADRDAPGTTGLLSTLEGRSPYVTTCPFLRAALDDGLLDIPLEEPDYANRCAAFGDPKPQSLRQQELVCLTSGHIDCPRYLRGAVVAHERLASPSEANRWSRPILAAVVFLAVSATASLAFVVARGGLAFPTGPLATDGVAAATATPGPTVVAILPTPPPPPLATPQPSPEPTPVPTPRPTPEPTPPSTPEPTPRPAPTSDRYQYLEPCATTPDCWVYTIRTGDALYNLARYFGHPLETVYRLNPWARNGIHAGDQLILPPPTR